MEMHMYIDIADHTLVPGRATQTHVCTGDHIRDYRNQVWYKQTNGSRSPIIKKPLAVHAKPLAMMARLADLITSSNLIPSFGLYRHTNENKTKSWSLVLVARNHISDQWPRLLITTPNSDDPDVVGLYNYDSLNYDCVHCSGRLLGLYDPDRPMDVVRAVLAEINAHFSKLIEVRLRDINEYRTGLAKLREPTIP